MANLAKQLVVGSAIAMAFLLVVYLGGLVAHFSGLLQHGDRPVSPRGTERWRLLCHY